MKIIQLSRGLQTIIDDADAGILSGRKWYARPSPGGMMYAMSSRDERMHRVVTSAPSGMVVDHINGDTLDNRRQNLRICEARENARNRRKIKMTASRFKGVSRSWSKWMARIRLDGHGIYLGTFALEEDAARAYDAAAERLFGEFARLNFPQEAA